MLSYYVGGVDDSQNLLSEQDRRILMAMIASIPALILLP